MSLPPKSTAKSRVSTADEALAAYRKKDFESAAKLFTVAIEEKFEVEWLIKRCGCYQRLKMDSDAIKDAQTVVSMHPENYKGYGMLGQIYASLGEAVNSFMCFLDSLEIIWISGVAKMEFHEVLACMQNVVRAAAALVPLSDNITEQNHLTQLYVIGNSLKRESRNDLAIRTFDIALNAIERETKTEIDLHSSDILKMKVHFALSQCLQLMGRFSEAIDGFKQSLAIALKVGDISCETKACLNLAALCMDENHLADAASFYIRLLAIGEDVLTAVGGDKDKFREHWSLEMESSILLNLCISYKSLHLYHEALVYATKYDDLVSNEPIVTPTPTPASMLHHKMVSRSQSVPVTRSFSRSFSTKSVDASGMLQSKFILGDLHELIGDLSSAMKHYEEWFQLSSRLAMVLPSGAAYILDSASALSCKGNVFMKECKYEEALECFNEQLTICRDVKATAPHMEALMSQGDVLVKMKKMEDARKKFQEAHKISRKMVDDLVPECFCMWKIASVFAAEHRYTHAAYYCEKALDLAIKTKNKAMIKKIKYELAMYYQHSTSQNELHKASKILHKMILFQEDNTFAHYNNGGRCLIEEEDMLTSCYLAMQVVMFKLGEHELSMSFSECRRTRGIDKLKSKAPEIPKLPEAQTDKEFVKDNDDAASVASSLNFAKVVNSSDALSHAVLGNAVVIDYTIVDAGILIHITKPGLGIAKSYFSAQYDAKPFMTRTKLNVLVQNICNEPQRDKTEKSKQLFNIYNTENRFLPDLKDKNRTVKLTASATSHDQKTSSFTEKVEEDVLAGGEGHHVVKTEEDEIAELTTKGFTESCKLLYTMLISPVSDVLSDITSGSSIVVLPDQELYSVPFDCLLDANSKTFGSRFNLTTAPSLSLFTSKLNTSTPESPDDSKLLKPDKELLKSFGNKKNVKALHETGLSKNFNKLVTETATGSNVIVSPRYVAPFKQSCESLKACVVGHPSYPSSLKYEDDVWKTTSKIPQALKECRKVSEYIGCDCYVGENATKDAFLREMSSCTLLHIATFADLDKGMLAFAPNSFPSQSGIPEEKSYLVTPHDLISTDCSKMQLLILSSGQRAMKSSSHTSKQNLAIYFLAAGVKCVLHQLWSVPNVVLECFYFHFYDSLQSESTVSNALNHAKDEVKKKFSDPHHWSCFVLIGSDVVVDLSKIRMHQLHNQLNKVENETLNLPNPIEEVEDPVKKYNRLQQTISRLSGFLSGTNQAASIVGLLIELLEEAMDRLTADSNTNRAVVTLPSSIAQSTDAIALLHLLGFGFQPTELNVPSSRDVNPAVLFPHWNKDGLLLPAHQALTGLQDICSSQPALFAIASFLPLPEARICSIIDLLAVTRHTPEVQLSIHDVGVELLWKDRQVQAFLHSIGFVAVHSLLVFYKTSTNRTLLIASLQFFASLCLHRDQHVLEQLNIATLGTSPPARRYKQSQAELPSINPVILSRNEVVATGSWMKSQINEDENKERRNLAKKIEKVKAKYDQALQHAKWWHNNLLMPQAQLKLEEFGSPVKEKQMKRKVLPGGTPSCQRVSLESPTDEELHNQQREMFLDAMNKRDYVHFLASQSYKEINAKQSAEVQDLFKHYACQE